MTNAIIPTETFWAISGIGWGRSKDSPEGALQNYYEVIARDFPHLTRAQVEQVAPPTLLVSPPEVKGFYLLGSRVAWTRYDGTSIKAADSDYLDHPASPPASPSQQTPPASAGVSL